MDSPTECTIKLSIARAKDFKLGGTTLKLQKILYMYCILQINIMLNNSTMKCYKITLFLVKTKESNNIL